MKIQALAKRATATRLSIPSVTLIIAPRERFSYIQPSLESIYKYTKLPFELIYIDIGSPKHLRHYLAQSAADKEFTLLRTERFISPNQVRNLGLGHATTDYVLFIDNDIHVSPGWLEKLLECAQETDATVVSPLMCIGKPLHERILMAGGEIRFFVETGDEFEHRRLYKKCHLVNRSVSLMQRQLHQRACDYAELSCLLVKRSIFRDIGPLDEKLLNSQEHLDFCLSVAQAGGKIYCEPASVVTYVPEMPRRWSDLLYFMLRWSDAWEAESLIHFQKKWSLDIDRDFMLRFKHLGQQRHQILLLPLLRRLTVGCRVRWMEKLAIYLERWFNQYLTNRYRRLSR
ncbi:glycosyltransferase family 2 protein [Leptolyngbyaceae cyanobacterium CCMR0082]|uniref:Glycosyltransferase family 2 protein n=1 Tax=Adonisia turfae CCMR0082 TaxID=2304604 RepID=A0A6M0SDH5_9CYAN|nr:glycosyltransferase [Adonisia turfae]NEZ66093.1 glycosyltransferase family 2 protein [Adonisia turfae CCMR0082]